MVETTLLFRVTVSLVIIGLIAFGYTQYRKSERLEESIGRMEREARAVTSR
jgi:hypothetical protein